MIVPTILTGVLIIVGFYVYRGIKYLYNQWKCAKDIPGPKGNFVLGNLLDLLGDTEHSFAFRHRQAEKYPDIFKLRLLHFTMVHLYHPDDVEIILTDMTLITKSKPYNFLQEWLGTGLLTSSGTKWQNRRKLLTPAFHFSILQEFLNIFNRETENLVKDIGQHVSKTINTIKPIAEYTLSSIGETSLGVQINKEPNCEAYKNALHFVTDFLPYRTKRPWLNIPFFSKLHPLVRKNSEEIKKLHNFSANVIKKRKQQLQDPQRESYSFKKRLALLDLLIKMKYGENVDITDEGIREEVDTFMSAGHDSTAISLCYTLQALANETKIQDELYSEIHDVIGDTKKYPDFNDLANMSFLERCIKESLRIYPSAPVIGRRATRNVKLKSGYVIPEGSDINLMIYNVHRSPKFWDNPNKFDPDRFLPENIATRHAFAYIPFSAGPRNCIGQKYAMLELKAALCGILRSFKLEPVTRPQDLRYKIDLVLRPVGEIYVKFVPRK